VDAFPYPYPVFHREVEPDLRVVLQRDLGEATIST
jgi:hypothetical protein